MTMDPKRNAILQDLTRAMIERILKQSEDMISMCQMVSIPQHEFEVAASSAFLYCFMELLAASKPSMTPHELGQIVEAQYKFYKELPKHDTKNR